MSHSAFVLAKSASGWRGEELDVHDIADLDELADVMRDIADGETAVFFLEEDDEYFALARVDGDDDPRGFISDVRSLQAATIGSAIFDGALEMPVPVELEDDEDDEDEVDDEEDESEPPEIEPAGDATLFVDLGLKEAELLKLCAAKGMLPADVITSIGESLGCLDELERVRGL